MRLLPVGDGLPAGAAHRGGRFSWADVNWLGVGLAVAPTSSRRFGVLLVANGNRRSAWSPLELASQRGQPVDHTGAEQLGDGGH